MAWQAFAIRIGGGGCPGGRGVAEKKPSAARRSRRVDKSRFSHSAILFIRCVLAARAMLGVAAARCAFRPPDPNGPDRRFRSAPPLQMQRECSETALECTGAHPSRETGKPRTCGRDARFGAGPRSGSGARRASPLPLAREREPLPPRSRDLRDAFFLHHVKQRRRRERRLPGIAIPASRHGRNPQIS